MGVNFMGKCFFQIFIFVWSEIAISREKCCSFRLTHFIYLHDLRIVFPNMFINIFYLKRRWWYYKVCLRYGGSFLVVLFAETFRVTSSSSQKLLIIIENIYIKMKYQFPFMKHRNAMDNYTAYPSKPNKKLKIFVVVAVKSQEQQIL